MNASVTRPDVAFLLPSLRGGGAERVLIDLAGAAAGRGLQVDMVVINRQEEVVSELGPGIRVVDLNRTRAATALPALARYLRSSRPPALLTTLEHTNVLGVAGARLAGGTRVVVREANTVSEDLASAGVKGQAIRELMRWTYRAAHGVVAVSQGVADSIVNELGLPRSKVKVIFNPVITPRLREGAAGTPDHPWFAAGQPPVVLGVGRLVEQKGFDTLLRAFARVRASADCRLMLLGEGPLREELSALASELGVEQDVAMPGFVDNPFPYMANCGLFVLSSRWEGLPNVLIQAMALGAKAVATDCPSGPKEVTDDGHHAPLVPVDDVEAMAQAMLTELRTDRRQLPAEWRARYSLEDVTSRYLDLLGVEAGAARAGD